MPQSAGCHVITSDKNRMVGQLYIHRDTLFYRLRRVEELFNADLDEPQLLQKLLVSLQLGRDGG